MSSSPRHPRRLYYSTGLISLILLPALCLWFLDRHKVFDKLGAIEVNWWTPNLHIDYPDMWPMESHPNKNYTDINLTGNDKNDRINLDFIQTEVRKLVESKDTTKGVHIHFSDKAKYWSLIGVLDICNMERAKYFTLCENDIWIFNSQLILRKRPIAVCGNSSMKDVSPILMDDLIPIKSDEQIKEEHQAKIKFITATVKTYFASGLLFILMTFLTVKQIYNRHSTAK